MYLYSLGEQILDAGEPNTVESFKLRNKRKILKDEYFNECNNAKYNLNEYKTFIYEEFHDSNNGEDFEEFFTDPTLIFMFEMLIRDYGSSPRFKQILEKIYIDAIDAINVIEFQGLEAFYSELQSTIQVLQTAFPKYTFSYQEATALLLRLTLINLETIINGSELALSLSRQESVADENSHKIARIRKGDFINLLKDFNENFDELPQLENPEKQEVLDYAINKFKSNLSLLKTRCERCPFDKVNIHTREIENTMLMSIITYAPYQLVHFIKFLLDQGIKLPLSNYKNYIYPQYFIDFDKETIDNAFLLELEGGMVNMDEFRQETLSGKELEETKNNLIHIEAESPKKAARRVRRTTEKTQ